MDNDNKIEDKSAIHQEVMLFLGDELNNIHSSNVDKNYDIEKEYEKTKKNKSPFVAILISGCLVVVLGLAFLMHGVISARNEEIAVSLQEFNDLNLKNLLNTVSSAQSKYDTAVKTKAQIQGDMETQLSNAKQAYENELFVIDSMKIKQRKVREEKIASVKQQYDDLVKQIHDEYDEKIAVAENEVQEYKKRLEDFDTAKVQNAREQEKALDSERRLRELETKTMTDRYENRIASLEQKMTEQHQKDTKDMQNAVAEVSKKYQAEIDALDPVLKDTKANKILVTAKAAGYQDLNTSSILEENQVSSEVQKKISSYQSVYNDYKYLDDVVASIPQENSIPGYVTAARSLVNKMSQTYVTAEIENYQEQTRLNQEIEDQKKSYEAALDEQKASYEAPLIYLLGVSKASAMILSATDYENICVFVTPNARYLITQSGADGEMKAGKLTVKGKIFKQEDGSFTFEVSPDKDGNLPVIDFATVEAGSIVKILSK